jgi:hypothetical protein
LSGRQVVGGQVGGRVVGGRVVGGQVAVVPILCTLPRRNHGTHLLIDWIDLEINPRFD